MYLVLSARAVARVVALAALAYERLVVRRDRLPRPGDAASPAGGNQVTVVVDGAGEADEVLCPPAAEGEATKAAVAVGGDAKGHAHVVLHVGLVLPLEDLRGPDFEHDEVVDARALTLATTGEDCQSEGGREEVDPRNERAGKRR